MGCDMIPLPTDGLLGVADAQGTFPLRGQLRLHQELQDLRNMALRVKKLQNGRDVDGRCRNHDKNTPHAHVCTMCPSVERVWW